MIEDAQRSAGSLARRAAKCRVVRHPRRWAAGLSLGLALALSAPGIALGFVPDADRVEAAVARTNVASGRDGALRLELRLQLGERANVAQAELVSHPTGLARLELRGAGGLVERHLLQGSALSASRNGRPLDAPWSFLPPFFVLQAEAAATLRAALSSFGVLVDVIGLADCGEADCLLIGDPAREVPRPELPPLLGLEDPALQGDVGEEGGEIAEPGAAGSEDVAESAGEKASGSAESDVSEQTRVSESEASVVEPAPAPALGWPRLWVDIESHQIRGIDLEGGVRVRFGPIASFEQLQVPAWFSIDQPGRPLARFDVLRAKAVSAPAAVFTDDWLLAPVAAENAPEQLPDSPEVSTP